MLAWIRNLTSRRSAPQTLKPARRTTLGLESLEVRDVPAVLGAASAYTVFGISNTDIDVRGHAADQGNLAVGRGGSVEVRGQSVVSGAVSLDRNTIFIDPKAPSVGSVQRKVDLTGAADDAFNGSAALAKMAATQTFRSIAGSKVIVGNGGTNVINVGAIDLKKNETLTLRGGANDYFYVNVSGRFDMKGHSAVVLTGGVQASHVIFNIIGRGDEVNVTGNAVMRGTTLAPQRDISLSGNLYGSIIGARNHDISLTGNARVFGVQFQEPVTTPTGTASVFGAVRYSRFGGDEVGPITGATVTLTDDDGNVVASTTTDASGNYTLGSLKAGSYTLRVSSSFGIANRSVELADGQAVNLNLAFND